MRQSTINNDIKEIIPQNLYFIKYNDRQPTIKYHTLLPTENIYYSGSHLLFCKDHGLKFDILEELKCERANNYYDKLFSDIENKIVDKADVKDLCNRHIGCFLRNGEEEIHKFRKFVNKIESECTDGYKEAYSDEYDIVYDIDTFYDEIER